MHCNGHAVFANHLDFIGLVQSFTFLSETVALNYLLQIFRMDQISQTLVAQLNIVIGCYP